MSEPLIPSPSDSTLQLPSYVALSSSSSSLDKHELSPSSTILAEPSSLQAPVHPSSNQLLDEKPSFNYDLDLFNQCKKYLETKNHHGLALIARQKGVPPFLRFKIWPLLLKYHPFVLNPFIQPDHDIVGEEDHERKKKHSDEHAIIDPASDSSLNGDEKKLRKDETSVKIKKDLAKYIQRLKYSSSSINLSSKEKEIFEILESSILKFSLKWGKIIKYDQSLTWIALNLAEWFPPIQNTPWVLVGRDNTSTSNSFIVNLLDDYSNYIDNIPDLKEFLDTLITDPTFVNMSFHDVYERLVLVLLHSPEERNREPPKNSSSSHGKPSSTSSNASGSSRSSSSSSTRNFMAPPKKLNKTVLPISGGTIEERVSFFIYCLRKVLPELSDYFHEEQILNKFGSHDDEWLIWWLNYCGSKVWSKFDRGRIWDSLLGWRLKNPKKDMKYYLEKLQINSDENVSKFLQKLGPDIFWSLSSQDDFGKTKSRQSSSDADDEEQDVQRRNSFKDLVEELNIQNSSSSSSKKASRRPSESINVSETDKAFMEVSIPFSQLDAHIELIFISLAFLKSKENILVELDQHEIRQFLSRLPFKSYKYKQKKYHNDLNKTEQTSTPVSLSIPSSPSSTSSQIITDNFSVSSSSSTSNQNSTDREGNNIIISNDSVFNHKVDFMNNIINEAGELWRKWLWSEMIEDN